MKQLLLKIGLIGFLCAFPFNLNAEEPLSADTIAHKAFSRDDGKDSRFQIEMTLISKKGDKRERLLDVYNKDYGLLTKNFIRFLSPADIEGTGFLSWENDIEDDTQYLYLPDLGRCRRIVSNQKDLRFVNTDFTYEDMQRRKPAKDQHRLVTEENWQGYRCYVVEYLPKDKRSSQYSKIIQWIEKESFVIVKAEFYNKKDRMFKRLTVAMLDQISGIWTAMDTLMEDIAENHKTRMRVLDVVALWKLPL